MARRGRGGRGERVLDACAAPGGKTTAMAAGDRATRAGRARDVRARRVRAAGSARCGAAGAAMRPRDPGRTRRCRCRSATVFDRVLIDAPCSGLGTVRRDPDIKWRRAGRSSPRWPTLQGRILDAAAAVVRPGGRLVYATCSSEPEENEEVVARFLERSPAFFGPSARASSTRRSSSTTPVTCGRCRSGTASRRSSPRRW